jgi:hypothetical protein
MLKRWRQFVAGALLATVVVGCADGGRGSSGFDLSEALLIQRVVSTQQCESRDALTFCPADQAMPATPTPVGATPTPPANPTPTATAIALQRVDTGVAHGTTIACTRVHASDPCRLTFSFQASGFAAPTAFRVASQVRPPATTWSVGPLPVFGSGDAPPRYDAPLVIDVPNEVRDLKIRFAVLVLPSSDDTLPARLDTLGASGADFAFVTPELDLEVITSEPLPTQTITLTPTVSATGSPAATPTATPSAAARGPSISYFGIARADSAPVAPSDFDDQGRPVFVRPFGSGFSLIVEGHAGAAHAPIGLDAFNPDGAPDLQLIVSQPLGDGSLSVCDDKPPQQGGVPATVPFAFSDSPSTIDALNDLGCRVDDGTGAARARIDGTSACTTNSQGDFAFVDQSSQAQFCLPIAAPWAFVPGDTIVAARLADRQGNLGPAREIVVRNAGAANPTATRTRRGTRTPTAASTATQAPTGTPTDGPSPTPSASATQPTQTPTATAQPDEDGPVVTFLGLSHADDKPFRTSEFDSAGRPRFHLPFGYGVNLVLEGKPGPNRRPPGSNAFSDTAAPDAQIILSQPLGDGSAAVCDTMQPHIGGVPGTVPLVFADDATAVATLNDLGCRIDDGTGRPLGRSANQACTTDGSGEFLFVDSTTTVQFCMPVAKAWRFAVGDTIIAARLRDTAGHVGPRREIVVRVDE